MLNNILLHRQLVCDNIYKSFNPDLEKGVYKDNPANRKAGKVGQHYGHVDDKRENYQGGFFPNVPHDKIKSKAEKIAKKLGYDGVYQAKGGSCYLQVEKGGIKLKVRIADHIENDNNRQRSSGMYDGYVDLDYFANADDCAKEVNQKFAQIKKSNKESAKKQEKQKKEQEKKVQSVATIKEDLDAGGYKYFKNDRTYMGLEEFKGKFPTAKHIKQVELGKKGGDMAYKYEWVNKEHNGKGEDISRISLDYLQYIKDSK